MFDEQEDRILSRSLALWNDGRVDSCELTEGFRDALVRVASIVLDEIHIDRYVAFVVAQLDERKGRRRSTFRSDSECLVWCERAAFRLRKIFASRTPAWNHILAIPDATRVRSPVIDVRALPEKRSASTSELVLAAATGLRSKREIE